MKTQRGNFACLGVVFLVLAAGIAASGGNGPMAVRRSAERDGAARSHSSVLAMNAVRARNDAAAQAAFLAAAPVFFSPRCLNCHPSGDHPLQGDDSHAHLQNVQRGTDGNGKYGLKCRTCHQFANLDGAHMPPGAPVWKLPPANMKMIFQGESAGQLCEQLKDPAQNGGRSLDQIVVHVTSDELVGWGWNPGDGRTLPPLSRDVFAKDVADWVANGAACPAK
jgi:hypothetical protein